MSLNDHKISLQDAAALTKIYRETPLTQIGAILSGLKGAMFSSDSLKALIEQQGCEAVRFYYAVKSEITPTFTLVAVGVDENDNDLENGIILDFAKACPPECSINNLLNS